jgi:hypothetical protein
LLDFWEIFVFATLVFAYFAFATLNFEILLLPHQFMYHFCPMWGKTKMKMMSFCFAFAPFVFVLVFILPHNGRK